MDRAGPLHLSLIPLLEKTDKDQGGSGGVHCHHPQLAEEILVPFISPEGMQDPSHAPTQRGSPVTTPAQQGHALRHRALNSPLDSVESEWHLLQDKGFSDAPIRTILATTRDTTRKVYNGKCESFISWCSERGQNSIHTFVKHILDFLQLKSEVLAVNTIKGYVTAI